MAQLRSLNPAVTLPSLEVVNDPSDGDATLRVQLPHHNTPVSLGYITPDGTLQLYVVSDADADRLKPYLKIDESGFLVVEK